MSTSEYVSPVVMERVQKKLPGDNDLCEMVEVRRVGEGEEPGELLACCMMSDDVGLEGIADALSSKRLWREANRFRQMINNSRKP